MAQATMKRSITTMSQRERIQVLSTLVRRMQLADKLSQQTYGGNRNLYQALGYPNTIDYGDYYVRYLRQDIAKAVIDRPVKATWKGSVYVIETDDDKETPLEKQWGLLYKELRLKSKFVRLDKLTGLGRYGILLFGLDDVRNAAQFNSPVIGRRRLLYVKPFGEGNVKISKYVSDTQDPRYGLPLTYSIDMVAPSGDTTTVKVHYSRVLHVTDDLLESEYEGNPRLEVVFNRLMDLEKIVGGSSEMFWRGARPGYQSMIDKDYQLGTDTEDKLQDELDEYENNLRRVITVEGLKLEALAQQITDPSTHVDIQIQMISAVTGIPKRILTGSERGQLASTQDKEEWLGYIQARREDFAESRILRPFIDRMIEVGVLPKPAVDYSIKWEDLFSISDKDKAEVGKTRATALKEYTANPIAESVIPPRAFMKYFLGLSKDDIDMIDEIIQSEMAQETPLTAEEQQIMEEE